VLGSRRRFRPATSSFDPRDEKACLAPSLLRSRARGLPTLTERLGFCSVRATALIARDVVARSRDEKRVSLSRSSARGRAVYRRSPSGLVLLLGTRVSRPVVRLGASGGAGMRVSRPVVRHGASGGAGTRRFSPGGPIRCVGWGRDAAFLARWSDTARRVGPGRGASRPVARNEPAGGHPWGGISAQPLVQVAPAPGLVRLEAAHHRVSALPEMAACVPRL